MLTSIVTSCSDSSFYYGQFSFYSDDTVYAVFFYTTSNYEFRIMKPSEESNVLDL